MTAQTVSFLKNVYFADNRGPGAIVPLCWRDTADTIGALGPLISVLQSPYSAAGDGVTNDTAAIKAAINALPANGGTIYLPGNHSYLVSVNSIPLPSNIRIIGEGPGSVLTTGTSAAFTGSMFTASSQAHIEISGLGVTSLNDDTTLFGPTTCSYVSIHHCTLNNANIFSSTQLGYTSSLTTASLCTFINISDNMATASTLGANSRGAIETQYCRFGEISRNTVVGHFHGIWWWGGNSDPAVNGIASNPRLATDLVFSDNVVNFANGGAGIWGSMGQRVVVVGNTIKTVSDVGIDFEGCQECSAVGNHVWDAANGNLSTFFWSRNVSFIGNHSVNSTGTNGYLYRTYNNTGNAEASTGTVIEGNTFVSLTTTIGTVSDGSGPSAHITIKGNKFYNSVVDFSNGPASANVVVEGNSFDFPTTLGAMSVIKMNCLSNSPLTETSNIVRGNYVSADAAQNAASIFIDLTSSDFNQNITYIVENNANCLQNPIATDIKTTESGGNAGRAGLYVVRNNMLTGGTHYTRTETGSGFSVVKWSDNYDGSGNYWPAAAPATGRWDQGTRVYFPATTASYFIGVVCTAAGTPGTWKTWGATSA